MQSRSTPPGASGRPRGSTILFTFVLLVAGAVPAFAQAPPAATVITVKTADTAQDIVDYAIDHPDKYLQMGGSPLVPVGHPSVSASDCVANPSSVGCRIADVRALAASQSVTVDKLCIPIRMDVTRKSLGDPLETVNGVQFDADWLLMTTYESYQSRRAIWRNGIFYQTYYDFGWVFNHEHACCHNDAATCSDTTECVVQYGSGSDVLQRFTTNGVVVDLRIPAYRQWAAERVIEQILDQGADCVGAIYKSGLWSYYDQTSNRECWQPDGRAVEGPTKYFDPCAQIGGSFSPTPYEASEYEAGLNDFFRTLFSELDSSGLGHVKVYSVDRPPANGSTWSWMDADVRSDPHLVGEQKDFNPNPNPNPQPSVAVYLLPPPPSGTPVHSVDIGIDTRGNATGPIDYHVWCNCTSSTSDLATAQAACGTDPGEYVTALGSNEDPILISDACQYSDLGTYIVKVIGVREGRSDEDRIALNVDPGPTSNSFADDTFSDLDWSHAVLIDTAGGIDTTSASVQVQTGGNPGEHQAGDHQFAAAGTVVEGHVFLANVYDPSVQGEIIGINASLDAALFSTSGGAPTGLDVGILVRQNGNVYVAWLGTATDAAWTSFAATSLVASDFELVGGSGNPDFSDTGALIEFGYAVGGDASAAGDSQWGVDNFQVEVGGPPNVPSLGAPAMGVLVAAFGIAAVFVLRRGRRARS